MQKSRFCYDDIKVNMNVEILLKVSQTEYDPCYKEQQVTKYLIKQDQICICKDQEIDAFYDSCIYLIVRAKSACSYYIYIWVGKKCSSKEYCLAVAHMSTFNMEQLQGRATENREIQGHESKQFLKLFTRFKIYKGRHFECCHVPENKKGKTKLYHVSGTEDNIRISQVAPCFESLNDRDVFILDMGKKIYQINGISSNKEERESGSKLSTKISNSRQIEAFHLISDFVKELPPSELNGIFPQQQYTKKITCEKPTTCIEKCLYKLSDACGKVEFTKIASGTLKKCLLDSKDVFIIDDGHCIYVWVGSQTSKTEKCLCIPYAQSYIENLGRSNNRIVKVLDGYEPKKFYSIFDQ